MNQNFYIMSLVTTVVRLTATPGILMDILIALYVSIMNLEMSQTTIIKAPMLLRL